MRDKMTDHSQEKAVTEFLAESEDILEEIGKSLVKLEEEMQQSSTNPEVVNRIFRGAHSLKGLSGMLGFTKVSELSHNLENMLDSLRLGKLELDGSVLDCLFESLETLNQLVVEIGQTGKDQIDISHALSKINDIVKGDKSEETSQKSPLDELSLSSSIIEVLTEYEEHRLLENIKMGCRLFEIWATFDLTTFDQDLQSLTKRLSEIGEIITTLPSTGESPESGIQFNLIVGTVQGEKQVKEIVSIESSEINEIQYTKEDDGPISQAAVQPLEGVVAEQDSFMNDVKGLTKTVRVDIAKLDNLMNLVGELILCKNMQQRIEKEMKKHEGFTTLSNDLHKSNDLLERKLSELQEGVLEVRMIPIGQIFNRLSRIIRKLSKASGKKINFKTSGEDTELDKLVIEDMADPLMHIIRNAIDHGIESPEDRKRLNKPAEGTIKLEAYQKGNHVVLEVEDDGAGMDVQIILAKAREKGLVQNNEALDEEQILNLLFLPGFSTAEKVSEVSGRGVGMDVVKKNITSLGGMIEIKTEPGKGTQFIITLPITLAIIPALIIRSSDQTFAIPLNAVSENLIVPKDVLQTVEKREVIKLRDRTLSLLRLQEIFQLPSNNGNGKKTHIVVAGLAEKKIGIIVDEFVDKEEIVIKPIGKTLKKIPGIAGATELGDKRAVLVLDVGSLIEEATQGVKAE